jgi:hypothetical protein
MHHRRRLPNDDRTRLLHGWVVRGRNGENEIQANSETQGEAWWRACEQARAVGMLVPSPPDTK